MCMCRTEIGGGDRGSNFTTCGGWFMQVMEIHSDRNASLVHPCPGGWRRERERVPEDMVSHVHATADARAHKTSFTDQRK